MNSSVERTVKRYSAYYRGWCTAFGEHDVYYEEDQPINWLYGEERMGLVVSPEIRKQLLRELLGHHDTLPVITLAESSILINELHIPVEKEEDRERLFQFRDFFLQHPEMHMFLTSHFCYPRGTRIITFSPQKPLLIIYKEIAPLKLTIDTATT